MARATSGMEDALRWKPRRMGVREEDWMVTADDGATMREETSYHG